MRFAVIGDIHSNLYALERVFEDINSREIDFVVSTGDLVGYLPFVNEVINMMRDNRVLVVQGNHDKYIADSQPITKEKVDEMTEEELQSNASSTYTNYVITEANRKYLKNLPDRLTISCSGLKVLVVHGSHRANNEYLYEDRESLEKLSSTLREDVIIFGHTHIPYYLKVNDKHFINAGSAGKPKHGDGRAAYVIVSLEEGSVESEIIKVDYEVEKIAKAIEDNPMISDKLIPMLREGF